MECGPHFERTLHEFDPTGLPVTSDEDFFASVAASAVTKHVLKSNFLTEDPQQREARLQALMVRALADDEGAYRELLLDLSARLRAYYRKRLANVPNEVEDLVQETLLTIHNQRHTYDVGRPLTAWCFAIAKYKLVDLLRRRARQDARTLPLDEEVELAYLDDLDAGDARRDLLGLLDELPDRHRLPIMYVKVEGRSVREAAQLTRMSESSVKIGIHRGLKTLARLIARS